MFLIKLYISFLAFAVWGLYWVPAYAQDVNPEVHIKRAMDAQQKGDYANALVYYDELLKNNELFVNLNAQEQDSLKLISLKGALTVSGMGKAVDMAQDYFSKHQSLIFDDFCGPHLLSLKIGTINNYIAILVYNKEYHKALEVYDKFISQTLSCKAFNQIDVVQASANVAIAHAKLNNINKALDLMPLLVYYRDSLNNWTKADYNKVLAIINEATAKDPQKTVTHFLKAADYYTSQKNYAYALNIYDLLLNNYSSVMDNNGILDLVSKTNKVRDSTLFYHNDIYNNMMKRLGTVLLERSKISEENKKLTGRLQLWVITSLLLLLLLSLYTNKKNKQSKDHYKKMFFLEKELEIQRAKLNNLKIEFVKNYYQGGAAGKLLHVTQALKRDFPNLHIKISEKFNNISSKEVQIIYCTLLNLSAKESAHLLSLTPGAYRVAKNRLIKKMNCDTSDEFQRIIKSLL
jgi:hypothetical protein